MNLRLSPVSAAASLAVRLASEFHLCRFCGVAAQTSDQSLFGSASAKGWWHIPVNHRTLHRPARWGTKPSILAGCAIPRNALNHSSGFISNSASFGLLADALSAASELESTVKPLVQIRICCESPHLPFRPETSFPIPYRFTNW